MKKVYYILLIFVIISCKKQEEKFVISGKSENLINDTIILSKRNFEKKIILNNQGQFKEVVENNFGYFNLKFQENNISLYLEPEFNLNISLDDNSSKTKFKNLGKYENEYLKLKDSLKGKLSDKELNMMSLYSKKENKFLKLIDSIKIVYKNLLNSQNKLSEKFLNLENKWIEVNADIKINRYRTYHKSITNNTDFKVSNQFPKKYENININDIKNIEIQDGIYIDYIKDYLEYNHRKNYKKNDSIDFQLAYLNFINKAISEINTKNKILYSVARFGLKKTKRTKEYFTEYKKNTTEKKYHKQIEKIYKETIRLQPGSIAPYFEFENKNGKIVTLNELKGKILYVDIWGTWCGPCLAMFPYLKTLEKEFNNTDIQFIGICMDENKENWLKVIEEKELGGIQLYTSLSNEKFKKDYGINSYPRYMLIDKEGKIINSNAKYPFEIKNELTKLLKK
jgi:thiol-disulfide isomerase/thioredoxin